MVGSIIMAALTIMFILKIFSLFGILPDYFQNLRGVGMGALAIGILLVYFCYAAAIFGTVMYYILIYKSWKAIQDGNARTTPGKAVGFLFIPFYNLYWIFQAWYGFAQDYNSYVERYSVTASKLNKGLFLAYCILDICSAVPFLVYLILVPLVVVAIIMVNKTIDAVNALPAGLPVEN
jgi:hypothetical protein